MQFKESELNKFISQLNPKTQRFYDDLSRDDRAFVGKQIEHFPFLIQQTLIEEYQKRATGYEANTYLRSKVIELNQIIPHRLVSHFDASEDDLQMLADDCAQYCRRLANRHICFLAYEATNEADFSANEALRNNSQKCEIQQADDSVNGDMRLKANDYAAIQCIEYVNQYGIDTADLQQNKESRHLLKRFKDKYWWLKKLRKKINHTREEVMIMLGRVNKKKGKYCSDLTLQQRILQKLRSETLLDNLVMINELGEELALREVFEANISNPVNRRYELMTRMNGFEKLSKELGHIALFVTVTCPSKYHNSYAKSGDRNPKWNGATPYEAQQYLNAVWRKTRAELARQAIQQYGFRIAEPQHDGTPHWHLLVFIEPKHKDTLIDIYTHYAMEEDGAEKGAAENRITFVDIDPQRGSATGYVAKYVSKNIDGGSLDSDIDGGDATEAARRVEAWASCWGIRQFQQLGNTSVTVWREMRRLKKADKESEQFQAIHKAADEGNWAEFVTTMGGVMCKRDEMAIRPYYDITIDSDTGEVKQSYFDEEPIVKIKGLKYEGKEIITREHSWRIERRQEKAA